MITNQGGFNQNCPTSKWTKYGVVICNFPIILHANLRTFVCGVMRYLNPPLVLY